MSQYYQDPDSKDLAKADKEEPTNWMEYAKKNMLWIIVILAAAGFGIYWFFYRKPTTGATGDAVGSSSGNPDMGTKTGGAHVNRVRSQLY